MSKAAQLAQNTKLYIAGTAGAAKTITAVTVGNPTIFTSAAHGLSNGDVVAMAAIVGTLGTDATLGVNGKSYVIKNKTTDKFAIELDSTSLVYTSGGTATPNAWTQIKELKSIKPSGSSSSKIDVTDLDSGAKEFRTGLQDNGTLSCDVNVLESDAGQAAVLAAFDASTVNSYKVVTASKTRTFDAVCTKFAVIPDASVDGVLTGSLEWQISGDVVVS